MRFLVVESETAEEREARRERAGKSSGESFAATLRQIVPGVAIDLVAPADAAAPPLPSERIADYDGVFLSGSPLHAYQDSPEVVRQVAFMRAVFGSGTPSFGSCAGLQVACVAAGGSARPMGRRREAGVARRLRATAAGADHPLLAGRPPVWDALAIHGDEVERLPEGAVALAENANCGVQAAEIRHQGSVFWGVQYHPELAPGEIATALRAQAGSLREAGLAEDDEDVAAQAELFERLQRDPDDGAVRWRLGIDDEVALEARRRTEIGNFIARLPELRRLS